MTIMADLESFVNGDSLSIALRFIDDDGNNTDVRGDVLYFTVKKEIVDSDTNAAIQVIYTIPIADEAAKHGVVVFKVSSEQTNVAAGVYHYDFQWRKDTSGNGEVETILIGKVKIIDGVTDS